MAPACLQLVILGSLGVISVGQPIAEMDFYLGNGPICGDFRHALSWNTLAENIPHQRALRARALFERILTIDDCANYGVVLESNFPPDVPDGLSVLVFKAFDYDANIQI
jgi:hypothetical protein